MLALLLGLQAAGDALLITGSVPRQLADPSSIRWVSSQDDADVTCVVSAAESTWTCRGLSARPRGVVVLVGAGAVASLPIGAAETGRGPQLSQWGRLVRVLPGGAALDDLADLRLTAWRPERSSTRPRARRLQPIADSSIAVLRLSADCFWATGSAVEKDAFLLLEGPHVASSRIPLQPIIDAPIDQPFLVSAFPPFSLTGRVVSSRGQDVEGSDVELFERLPQPFSEASRQEPPMLLYRARTRTKEDGSFAFERIATAAYQVVATHRSSGRGLANTSALADQLVIRLSNPGRVSGRVLRGGLPVDSARIRFVPDPIAWAQGVDPMLHVVDDAFTDTDGRFTLPLPPERAGTLQIIASDGVVARLAPPPVANGEEASLGDINLSAPLHATLRVLDGRVLDGPPCDLVAVGPLERLGFSLARTPGVSGLYELVVPEAGDWALSLDCAGRSFALDPGVITVSPDRPGQTLDLRIAADS